MALLPCLKFMAYKVRAPNEFRTKLADTNCFKALPNHQDKENPQITVLHKSSPSNPRCTGVPLTHQRLIPLKRSAISAA